MPDDSDSGFYGSDDHLTANNVFHGLRLNERGHMEKFQGYTLVLTKHGYWEAYESQEAVSKFYDDGDPDGFLDTIDPDSFPTTNALYRYLEQLDANTNGAPTEPENRHGVR